MSKFRPWELEFFILKELPKHKMEKIEKLIFINELQIAELKPVILADK